MRAKIRLFYDIGAFKPILPVEGGNLPLFSNLPLLSNVHMKAEISLDHQESCQC